MRPRVLACSLLAALAFTGCAAHRFSRQRIGVLPAPAAPLAIDERSALALDAARSELTRQYFDLHAPGLGLQAPFRMEPKVVVVHYTVSPTLGSTLRLFRQPEIVAGTWKAARAQDDGVTEADSRTALQKLDPMWDELFPAEQARIVALLVERVDIGISGLNVRLRTDGLAALAREITADAGAAA